MNVLSKKKLLITGADGFIGSHWVSSLAREPFFSTTYQLSTPSFNLLDEASVDQVAQCTSSWNTVIHLAAMSHVPSCEKDPSLAEQVNFKGTERLLQALYSSSPSAPAHSHFIFFSTAQVYAAPTQVEIQASSQPLIFEETRAIQPQNVYAQTKWAAEEVLCQIALERGLPVTILRLFNHTHQSQSPDFFLPSLYHQMQQISEGQSSEIRVGNLDLWRDIGSLSDLLRALTALLQSPPPSPGSPPRILNLCSGRGKNLRSVAELLAKRLQREVVFVTDPTRVRAHEALSLVGSPRRFSKETGWQPTCHSEADLVEAFLSE